ncbi:hypothetical protein HAZT_HAZT003445 [Hyalella azteca]|uniref:RRM domain-containing protein n=1 Tax=Hyalella azteca TaxID=294128 RepID=A0A6A0H505_HYAAZ|nr:hypothetical protein HAZT_HAZT003445 [Hyalella azteca]
MNDINANPRCYGFVDFESPASAEKAVRTLQSMSNLQAQMAKQQEQDPTNLYIANLPHEMNEAELDALLAQHATEMCEKVIRLFNKKTLAGSKEPLLVKFADYGNKRKTPQYRARDPTGVWDRHDDRVWEVCSCDCLIL